MLSANVSPPDSHGMRTAWLLIVMPRSRSMSIRSRYCARMSRSETTPVICSIRSASVDLPWSMWAMMQKLRIAAGSVAAGSSGRRARGMAIQSPTTSAPSPAPPPSDSPPSRPWRAARRSARREAAGAARRVESMPVPEFVVALREKVGTDPLWLIGVTAIVLDGDRVLLGRRADTGRWSTVSGIVEPGEHPAVAVVREVLEETGVTAVVERLAAVSVTKPIVYPNGDRTQYTDLTFRCRYVSGAAVVADDESLEVGWFPVDALPDLDAGALRRVMQGLSEDRTTTLDLEPR